MADQLLMNQKKPENEAIPLAEESNNNKEGPGSPPGTPPPNKRRAEGGDSSGSEGTPPKNQGLIKAKGTYYPLTAFPTSMPQGPVMRRGESPPQPGNEQGSSGKYFFHFCPFLSVFVHSCQFLSHFKISVTFTFYLKSNYLS